MMDFGRFVCGLVVVVGLDCRIVLFYDYCD